MVRFLTALLTLVAGFMLIVVALLRFRGLGWLALGFGTCATVMALAVFPLDARGASQRVGDVVTALIGGWTIVASRAFDGSALRWLGFADGAALAAVSILALILSALLMARDLAQRQARASAQFTGRPAETTAGNGYPTTEHARG